MIVIKFSIIGIFIKDYKNSLITVSIVNDNNIKLSNAFTKVKEDTVNKEVDNNKKITIRFYNIDNNQNTLYNSNVTIPKEVERNIDPAKETLNNKIVTMDELINVGFKPLKKNTYAIK